jgi:uncharacterized SAM-binding protein YcdF (DUF218 family)
VSSRYFFVLAPTFAKPRPIPGSLVPGGLDWARGLALFFGGFTLLNLLGNLRRPGFDADEWWLDLRLLPGPVAELSLAAIAVLLLAFGIRPAMGTLRRRITLLSVGLASLSAVVNLFQFYKLLGSHAIRSDWPFPFSIVVALAMAAIVRAIARPAAQNGGRLNVVRTGLALTVCLVAFPLAQVLFFGNTDYRRRADAILVMGARAYADGRLSDALADRVKTGCELFREGRAPRIIFSGGPGDGAIHETESMRRRALELGVPSEAILLDKQGLNTRATVRNSRDLFAREGTRDALGVSHFYHLPRLKLEAQRAGINLYTVPARQSRIPQQTPWSVCREVVALWVYYLHPLFRP